MLGDISHDPVGLLLEELTVPAGQEVCATWKETSLEDTQNESQWDHLVPSLDEAKAHHRDAPQYGDGR